MAKEPKESIQKILNTLNDWKGSELEIKKEERNDIDKNNFSLEDVEVVRHVEDEDDYVDPYSIELKGRGTVISANGTHTLPLNSYNLPINQLLSFEASKDLLTIKTDRATYFIKNK